MDNFEDNFQQIYAEYGLAPKILYKEEHITSYKPGGYHPVDLGDTLRNGRYTIRHKLGFGATSTVWLARDNSRRKWVSVKIVVAKETNSSREVHILRALQSIPLRDTDVPFAVGLIDHFVHEGPNGRHQCLVLELTGPTLMRTVYTSLEKCKKPLSVYTIFQTAEQLLKAIAATHAAGYAHGDISPANFTMNLDGFGDWSMKKLFEMIGQTKSNKITRVDGAPLGSGIPEKLVRSAQWPRWPPRQIDLNEDVIRMIDFGQAFRRDSPPEKLYQPFSQQPPEMIFCDTFDHTIDLWRAGLTIYYLVFGRLPFPWWGLDTLVTSMINFVGDLPSEWQPKWEQIKCDAEKPTTIQVEHNPRTQLQRDFDQNLSDPRLKFLLPVLEGLLRFRPSDRTSAEEALHLLGMADDQWSVSVSDDNARDTDYLSLFSSILEADNNIDESTDHDRGFAHSTQRRMYH